MDTKILEDIGLTRGEIKTYLALLSLGQSTTGPIAKKAGVSRSKLYVILDKLVEKGFVGHVVKGKTKYFSAHNSKRMIDFIEEKKAELERKEKEVKKILPQIDLLFREESTDATIFEGFKGVTNLFRNMLDTLNKGDEYYVLGGTYGDIPGLRPFFHNFHKDRSARGIRVKMLVNKELEGNIETPTHTLAKIKYLPDVMSTKMEIVIYKKTSFIILWTRIPVAFLLQNEEATKSFKKFFDSFWNR